MSSPECINPLCPPSNITPLLLPVVSKVKINRNSWWLGEHRNWKFKTVE